VTRKTLSLRFGREPIVRNSEYRKAQALTAARHKPDATDRAKALLDKLRADDEFRQAKLDAIFAELAGIRADLRGIFDEGNEA
jgi:hypothetical protein